MLKAVCFDLSSRSSSTCLASGADLYLIGTRLEASLESIRLPCLFHHPFVRRGFSIGYSCSLLKWLPAPARALTGASEEGEIKLLHTWRMEQPCSPRWHLEV